MSDEFTSAEFYARLAGRKLMGSRCRSCGAVYLPPRPLCPACFDDDMEWTEMSGKGRLLAYTIVHIASTAMIAAGHGRDNPHCSGIVQLDGGPAISAQIVGVDPRKPASIRIGAPASVEFIDRGEGQATKTFLAFRLE